MHSYSCIVSKGNTRAFECNTNIGGCGVNFENIRAEIDESTFIANKSVGNIYSPDGAIYKVIVETSSFAIVCSNRTMRIAAGQLQRIITSKCYLRFWLAIMPASLAAQYCLIKVLGARAFFWHDMTLHRRAQYTLVMTSTLKSGIRQYPIYGRRFGYGCV